MRIKYGELPPTDVIQKLLTVSFNTPKKNLAVYKFCSALKPHIDYLENERTKLVQKHGEADKDNPMLYKIAPNTMEMESFLAEWNEVLQMDVEDEIQPLPLSERDFDNCSYSPEKMDWLNARDIGTILRFCE